MGIVKVSAEITNTPGKTPLIVMNEPARRKCTHSDILEISKSGCTQVSDRSIGNQKFGIPKNFIINLVRTF